MKPKNTRRTNEPSFTEISSAFHEVETFVGKEWLESELEKLAKRKQPKNLKKYSYLRFSPPHPLVLLWRNAINKLRQCIIERRLIASEELLQIYLLGRNLKTIKKLKVVNLRGELTEATVRDRYRKKLRDPKEFEKAIYEIQIASSYARAGYPVFFIEETTEKTPDFMVKIDGEPVYVECKNKDAQTERDKNNNRIWEEMREKILRLMEKLHKNYLIIVKSQTDPKREEIDYVLRIIKDIMLKSKNGRFIDRTKKYGITAKELAPTESIITTNKFEVLTSEALDNVFMGAEVRRLTDGRTELKNPKFIGFKSAAEPDRITGVLRSLNKSYKQIPRKGPGLVYIEIHPSNALQWDFNRLEEKIRGKLNLIKRVNAVVLTATFIEIKKEGIVYRHKSRVIENVNPRSPLPAGFNIVGLSK